MIYDLQGVYTNSGINLLLISKEANGISVTDLHHNSIPRPLDLRIHDKLTLENFCKGSGISLSEISLFKVKTGLSEISLFKIKRSIIRSSKVNSQCHLLVRLITKGPRSVFLRSSCLRSKFEFSCSGSVCLRSLLLKFSFINYSRLVVRSQFANCVPVIQKVKTQRN